MVDKLNLKRDKIQDIHETLKHADINGDDKLDFDEWRQDLKTYTNLKFFLSWDTCNFSKWPIN